MEDSEQREDESFGCSSELLEDQDEGTEEGSSSVDSASLSGRTGVDDPEGSTEDSRTLGDEAEEFQHRKQDGGSDTSDTDASLSSDDDLTSEVAKDDDVRSQMTDLDDELNM